MNKDRIDIYGRIGLLLFIEIILVIFTFLGWFVIKHPYSFDGSIRRYSPEFVITIGYITIILCCLCFIYLLLFIVARLLRRPIVKIYDNRIECYIPIRFKYKKIPYIDVASFRASSIKLLTIGRWKIAQKHIIINKEKRYYPNYPDIIEPDVSNIDELCNLLNQKLEEYKNRPTFTQTLTLESLPCLLSELGIESDKYSFEEIARPDITTIVRKKASVEVTYYNRYSEISKCSRYRIEHNACHAFLEYLLR